MLSKFFRVFVPSSLVLGALLLTSTYSFAKPDYTKKEKKACAFCHTTATSKELNAVGKCYAEHNHSLEGCAP